MRILFIIIAVLLVIAGGACAVPSAVTYRALDSGGFINGSGHMSTDTAALVTNTAQFREVTEKEVEEGRAGGKVRLRFEAERSDGGDVLVAVGSADAIQALVVTGSYEIVDSLQFDPFDYRGVARGGRNELAPPEDGLFVTVASGPGHQEVVWTIVPGAWRAIIMNADGSAGVDVDVRFGARFPYVRGFAIAGMVIGVVLIVIGIAWLAFLFRPGRNRNQPPAEPATAE